MIVLCCWHIEAPGLDKRLPTDVLVCLGGYLSHWSETRVVFAPGWDVQIVGWAGRFELGFVLMACSWLGLLCL